LGIDARLAIIIAFAPLEDGGLTVDITSSNASSSFDNGNFMRDRPVWHADCSSLFGKLSTA